MVALEETRSRGHTHQRPCAGASAALASMPGRFSLPLRRDTGMAACTNDDEAAAAAAGGTGAAAGATAKGSSERRHNGTERWVTTVTTLVGLARVERPSESRIKPQRYCNWSAPQA
jgi:hypothetical protein